MTNTDDFLAGVRAAQQHFAGIIETNLVEITENLLANIAEPCAPTPEPNARLGQAIAWLTYTAAQIRETDPTTVGGDRG